MPPKIRKDQVVCPNPLFLMWLEEWKQEAEERDLNSRYTYGKAIASLKRYPLPLNSGKEAVVLENIGEHTANRLDKRLKQYLEDGGDPVYLHKIDPVHEARMREKENREKKYVCKYRSGPYAVILTLYQDKQKPDSVGYMTKTDLQTKAQPLADKSFTVPDPGSRYTAWSSVGTLCRKGYVVKRSSPAQYSITDSGCELALRLLQGTHELPEQALGNIGKTNNFGDSRNSDDSQTNTQGARSTGHLWDRVSSSNNPSSVNNLLAELRKNNLVGMTGTPTATSPVRSVGSSNAKKKKSTAQSSSTNTSSAKKTKSEALSDSNSKTTDAKKTKSSTKASSLSFWYVMDGDRPTVVKSKALVNIFEDLGVGFLVKVNMNNLVSSGKKFQLDETRRPKDGCVYVYLGDDDCEAVCNPPTLSGSSTSATTASQYIPHSSKETKIKTSPPPPHPTTNSGHTHTSCLKIEDDDDDEIIVLTPSKRTLRETSSVKTVRKCLTVVDDADYDDEDDDDGVFEIKPLKPDSDCSINLIESDDVLEAETKEDELVEALPAPSPASEFCSSTPAVLRVDKILEGIDVEPLFILSPGTFDIILCVDTTETSGTGRRKKELADKIAAGNVPVDVRKLQLGDFLWIAKEKTGARRELVLDYIIERKRMDDLAGSIMDGRFNEQKFRLRSCALKQVIYLVERFGNGENVAIPAATLRQAITNTQIYDNFFMKETVDIYDSAEYITTITKQLAMIYSEKILFATTFDKIEEIKTSHSHERILQEDIQYLMTFQEFSMQTEKNKVLLVKEHFIKHLIQIKGLTLEKAMAITHLYPTPSLLVQAYDGLATVKEKEKMLSNIDFGKRKIGDHMSQQVYLLYSK